MNDKILQKLTHNAKESLLKAIEISRYYGFKKVNPDHLLLAILSQKGSAGRNILIQMGAQSIENKKILQQFKTTIESQKIKHLFSSKLNNTTLNNFSQELKNILIRAFSIAGTAGFSYVGTEHLIYTLIENPLPSVKKIIDTFDKPLRTIETSDTTFSQMKITPDQLAKLFNLPFRSNLKSSEYEKESGYLKEFGTILNKQNFYKSHSIIGRKKEINKIINILSRKIKNNPLLIGDPGVGKTALVEKLALEIKKGNVPYNLLNKKIINLDLTAVVAGTTFRGEFENRLKEIIKEVKHDKNIILFIDEIHSLVGAGNVNGSLDAANILKPALSRGEIQCIGATTFDEYKKYIEKDAALERRFQTIQVTEPSFQETLTILKGIRKDFEKYHSINISDHILEKIIQLTQRYLPERFFPDKAIDVLDESSAYLHNQQNDTQEKRIIQLKQYRKQLTKQKEYLILEERYTEAIKKEKEEKQLLNKIKRIKKTLKNKKEKEANLELLHVAQTIADNTGISLEKILSSQSDKLKKLPSKLNQIVIGQKKIIEKITDTLYYSQSGISNLPKPLASFLFVGPTGVGKTFLAQSLANYFFNSPQSLIRIDMSEFMERHNISRLIGAPAGYIGYEEGGQLTEKIKRQPYSLILFDEIEKAHSDISNILLQILDGGFLTDASGHKIDFKNTIIILTSNLGTENFNQINSIGFSKYSKKGTQKKEIEEIKKDILKKLRKQFRPELLNRLDDILVFQKLSSSNLNKIVRLHLKELEKNLAYQKINISFDSNLIKWITEKSIDDQEGARLVRKNIQKYIEIPLAKELLENKTIQNPTNLITHIKINLNRKTNTVEFKLLSK